MTHTPSQASPIPLLTTVQRYRREWLAPDAIAGISVCIVMIPSVLAYSELAGLPPMHGMYAALAALVGYALFASSRQVIAGPDAAVALLVVSAIGPLANGDPVRAAMLAAILALIGALIMITAAVLRIGAIADFLSKPVLVGFMAGAALILISTQLGKLLGIAPQAHDFFPLLVELWKRLNEAHGLTVALGGAFLALLIVLQIVVPKVPGALVLIVVAIVASLVFDLEGRGVKVIGEVAAGLPRPVIPRASLDDVAQLIPAAFGIALLTFPEGILLARAFAAKNGYEVRANQELVALAAANAAAGVLQGFPVSVSSARTTINDAAGAKTQVSSIVAAVALVAFLLFLTPLLKPLPTVALAALLVFVGARLINPSDFNRLRQLSFAGFALAICVTLAVLIFGVVPGIGIGVTLTLLVLLKRLARPFDAILHELAGSGRYHDLDDTEGETVPGLVAYRFYAPLFFPNAEHFVERVKETIASARVPVRWFVLDAQAIWDVDLTAADAIQRLFDDLRRNGIEVKVARANRPLRERFERLGITKHLGEHWLYPSVHSAVEAFQSGTNVVGP